MLHFALALLLAPAAATYGRYDFTIVVRNRSGLAVTYIGQTMDHGKLTVTDMARHVKAGGFGVMYGWMEASAGSVEYESKAKTRDGEQTRNYTLHFRVGAERNEASCDSSGELLGKCTATIDPKSCKGQEDDCRIDLDLTFTK
ncbi:MAG TPA: hypothetical protein VJ853_04670 [Thermoanaerobaculia bacterium]|nr:hypothetical protein [Thermoanaerobaculia bacterium]